MKTKNQASPPNEAGLLFVSMVSITSIEYIIISS